MPAVKGFQVGGLHGIEIEGLPEMQRAFRKLDKDLSKELRGTLKKAAEPVRASAEVMAKTNISNIDDMWPRMRTGVTTNVVYVAPRTRGQKGDVRFRRPNFANLLMDRAMAPALNAHAADIEASVGKLLDHLFKEWEKM